MSVLPSWVRSLGRAGQRRQLGPIPLLLSSPSEAALRRQADELATWVRSSPVSKLPSVAMSLASDEAAGSYRAAIVGTDRDEMLAGLDALARGTSAVHLVSGRSVECPNPAFVFPGQGAQWAGMGLELLEGSEVFRRRLDDCAAALAPELDVPLLEVLRAEEGHPYWRRLELLQPALWALSVALADTWRSFGVEPGAIVGHSIGEVAGAYAAGAMSLEDSARLAVRVGKVYAAIEAAAPRPGAMASVAVAPAELEERLRRWGGRLEIACLNGPRWCVATGDGDAIRELLEDVQAEGIGARQIDATAAGHSIHCEPLREKALADLTPLSARPAAVPYYSGLRGDVFNTATFDAAYFWAASIRRPVLFEGAIRAAIGDETRTFVELSPHPVLTLAVEEIGEEAGVVALGTLRRDRGGEERLLAAVAEAWVRGVEVDWRAYFERRGARRVQLPAALSAARVAGDAAEDVATGATSALGADLQGLSEGEQERFVLDLVRAEVAALAGTGDSAGIDIGRPFRELGFESAAVAELRNRLSESTGLRLPAAVAFDYPTAGELAAHLRESALELKGPAVPLTPAVGFNDEPIAIVGVACRYPGAIDSAEELWRLVASGGSAIAEFPDDRGWSADPYDDGAGARPTQGGFLRDAGEFDPGFFGISPREALAMDPQQRLLLECAWEALESAGIDPSELRGSASGVFAGISGQDYGPGLRGIFAGDEDGGAGQQMTGTVTSLVSGRIAYSLGFEGPAMTIDTACSSSLVAMHLAAQALRSGECEMALAGGVTVMATPGLFTEMSRQRGLAPDGRCKSFSADADGTGWSEGSGLLLLERLSDAKAKGHRILALIKGSATNQDGASNGLTAPNGPSQERVIRQALANAGLKPSEVDAVEAHGTGTTLGDPIEAQALLATYGQERETPLQLGSLKSNIGHTQAAAGVGGVIKMVMALREEALPKTLHVSEPTPHVDWSAGEIELLTEQRDWPKGDKPRRAGVSSFGISGTNAHVIIEEAPVQAAPEKDEAKRPPLLPFVLSAKSPEALAAAAGRLAAHLEDSDADSLDVAHTLLNARAQLEQRAVIVAADQAELLSGLDALAQGKSAESLATAKKTQGPLAFLLSGQGSQRPQMGKGLYEAFPVYADAFDSACNALANEGIEVKEALWAEPGTELAESLKRTDLTQASLFALQVALHSLLASFAVQPDYLLGHSVGEIVAAHLAGVFDLPQAARLLAARAKLMATLPEGGAMGLVGASEKEVEESLAPYAGRLTIAAVNAPTQITVSGDEDALTEWQAEQTQAGRETRALQVSHAFHSHRMEPMLGDFQAQIAGLRASPPKIPVISNRSGAPLTAEQAADPAYWASQVRQEVRFADGLAYLAEQGTAAYLELGAAAVLSALVAESDPGKPTASTLRHQRGDRRSFLTALGTLHAAGQKPDLASLLANTGASATALPTYPFQRQRYWLEASRAAGDLGAAGQASTDHPLLAASIPLAEGSHLLTGRISQATHPWLAEHAVAATAILPGTAFVELCLRAGQEVGAAHVQELVLEAPLIVPEQGAIQLQLTLAPKEDGDAYEVLVHSRPEPGADAEEEPAPFTRHASATLTDRAPEPLGFDATDWPPAGGEPIATDDLYARVAATGLEYGPAFQGLGSAWALGGDLYAEVALAPEQAGEAERYAIHPALLDAALHTSFLGEDAEQGLRLPFSFAGVFAHSTKGPSALRIRLSEAGGRLGFEGADAEGAPVFAIAALGAREVDPGQLGAAARPAADSLFAIRWQEVELPRGGQRAGALEIVRCASGPEADRGIAARRLCGEVLERLQGFLAEHGEDDSRLLLVTEGAMAVRPQESTDPAPAAVWGLVRAAQTEHPGRFVLIDSDGAEASERALAAADRLGEEPQLALREGTALAPRLGRASGDPSGEGLDFDPEGTVLVTGGLSGLGALVACHLARAHGARRLLLASRRGTEAPGAGDLIAELAELGCEAAAVACDVSDREQVDSLIAGVSPEHPLAAVVHCAGVADDGVLEALDAERLGRTMAPKADGAWHLHEATRDLSLSAFVLFSSAAATVGTSGQGNYAAANSFLDALAQRRRAAGLAATSIGWGLWGRETGMASELSEVDRGRLARLGYAPLADGEGLALFDRAVAAVEAVPLPIRLDRSALRERARTRSLPPLFADLVPAVRTRGDGAAPSSALALAPEEERPALALELVRKHAAAVLGHAPEAIEAAANFRDLGFDSLGAVELRNRLDRAGGLRLVATAIFDYPTPESLARHLVEQVEGSGGDVVVKASRGSEGTIAIVGLSCRFPGGVDSAQELWELVRAGGDGITEFPADRGWEVERLYDPDPERVGKTYSRQGGFLHEAPGFDPGFFGISPHEALAMDPQQRLLLEAAWEALEDAGIDPATLRGSNTGVFAGAMYHEYATDVWGGGEGSSASLEGFASTGSAASVVSGRLSYLFGLEGPAVTIDTACSSSLVAMHLAAQALRGGECDLALAGGATVMPTPRTFVEMSRQRGLAPDGRCKSFSADADGTGWSEGSGLLLLERLSDAKAKGHRILAVIKGSATNQDGASNGLTAPNGPSQERVIRQALANAGLKPSEVDAVEAHGTGTTLGDPIEAQALLATYGQERETPLQLGSLKSNIGHTQAAAGVGGVIKMVMALREEALPQTLHVSEPTPHVDWSAGEIELLTEERSWPKGDKPRRAGVSSFGISGTNAHVIIEEAPEQPAPEKDEAKRPPLLPFALSAKSPEALSAAAGRLAAHLEESDSDSLDVAHTLLNARAQLDQRAVIVAADQAELLSGLDALAQGKSAESLATAKKAQGPLAFLLSGQGSQRPQMGKGLYEAFPVYADAFDSACAALAAEGIEVRAVLEAEPGTELAESLKRTDLTQASLFALQTGLFALASSYGLKPDYLLGHSVGEIVAAHLSGVFSLPDAAKLIAARGRLMAALPSGGAMAWVRATEAETAASLVPFEGRLSLAAVNSPHQITVSGDEDALTEWQAEQAQAGRETRALQVSHAFHSHRMEPMLAEFEEVASTLSASAPQTPVISNRSGAPLTAEQAADPAYWASQVRQEVRFADGLAYLKAQGVSACLELGPAAVLSALVAEQLPQASRATTLRHEREDARSFLLALGGMHAAGQAVDFAPLFKDSGAQTTALPTYPFQRQRYWLETSRAAGDLGAAGQASTDHPLLAASIPLAEGSHLLTGRISQATHPWLAEHAVAATAILPGTAFVELALRAGQEVGAAHIQELVLEAPLIVPEQGAIQLQLTVTPKAEEEGTFEVLVHSRPEPGADAEEEPAPFTRHASATLTDRAPEPLGFDATDWPPAGAEAIATDDLYERVAAIGLEYGPAFQGLGSAWRLGEDLYAEVALAPEQEGEAERYAIHPALLDAALHTSFLGGDAEQGLRLPFSFAGVFAHGAKGPSALRIRLSEAGGRLGFEGADAEGAPVFSIAALGAREVDPSQLGAGARPAADSLFAIEWKRVELPAGEEGEVERLPLATDPALDPVAATHALTAEVLTHLQAALAAEPGEGEEPTRLAFLSEGALALDPSESPDPALAAAWGLIRSAQSEHPGRFLLIDSDGSEASEAALKGALALAAEEPQLALRAGVARVPRLALASASEELALPDGHWRLARGEGGTLETLGVVGSPEAERPLGEGEVRVAVHTAGLNFRDVLIALGLYPGEAQIGGEGAGVVLEAGEGVDLKPGDRVFGLMQDSFGPLAVAPAATLVPLPEEWSFEQGAALPIVGTTAYFGLHDLAGLKAGERVLVHAGAGGVGMVAIQLAQHLGAEVFATASPGKWEALRALGLDEDHIASSRDLGFRDKFLQTTAGEGVDVVLDSLAREFVDASLELLPRGGRFLEMGKTDVRDPERVAGEHPGVAYRAFDVVEAGPRRSGEILAELLSLFERGALRHSPISPWDIREARAAFRCLSQARHIGKLVLTIPPAAGPEGTVLITGGLSGIGALTARHLAQVHGAKRLLLTSRRGDKAPGAAELIAELAELGCAAEAVACDVSDREQVDSLVAGVSPEHPLTAIVHSAGLLDDGTIEALDPARLDTVLAPKADAAWHLHEATRDLGLAAFVLYSSAAASFGSPGQGNYAAANSFLDALAARRRAEGLPATAIAWGLWEGDGMGAELGEADRARLARLGFRPLAPTLGLELLDRARGRAAALALATPLEAAALRRAAAGGTLAPLFSALFKSAGRRARASSGSLARRLAAVSERERGELVLALVREHAAAVLGHASAEAIEVGANFKDLGFDSLGTLELRNRLVQVSGVQLEATALFDHPTPQAVAAHLLDLVEGEVGGAVVVRAARGSDEPIAIVGMSCRFPGGASSPERLWRLLAAGANGIGRFPADRGWDVDGVYDSDPERAGKSYVREGGFLAAAGEFDPGFFGISPREALAMDPQQRLLLEAAWEALESAGLDPGDLRASDTGVFAGVIHHDYGGNGSAAAAHPELEGYRSIGIAGSVASGRIAYALGLEGPAMTIDTACSSSLVAMHLAAQALRGGECELALAGGATVMAGPEMFVEFSRQRGLARDGRCKSFSADADGTGWSEGSGLLLLERLSDAKRNGHRILALIKGSATNQDGASNGLTAPNGPSQERVIRQALANAGLKPSEVDAVEAHGTGTTLGDPIEAQALLATYGQERETPLALGSLKSNIGHTQAAAGVGGVIKMVMALREEALPKTLHVSEPTPHVDWSAGEIELLTEERSWPKGDKPRRAGVSSFGISGTNAHLIIEEAPEQASPEKDEAKRPPLLPFALSAKGPEALSAAAGRLAAHLEENDADGLDVAHTLLNARAQLEQRAVIVAGDEAELLAGLDALAQGKPAENLTTAKAASHTKAVFCFPGQGSQWLGMASELLEQSPLFAEQIAKCEVALSPHMETPLTELLRSEDDQWLSKVELVQPALFAVMVALAGLWRSYGVEPAAVIGHSQGEIAAAVISGALTLEDGAKLAALRAKSLMGLMGKGEMASVQASAEEAEPHLKPYGERVAIAAHNGPRATVLSGEPEAISELIASFEAQGTRARLIAVGYASHCAQIEAIEDELKQAIGEITAKDSEIPFYSTLSGEPIQTSTLDAEYWYRNLREPVRFRQATERLLQDGHSALVEISAHPVLAMALSETAEAQGKDSTAILHSLRRGEGNSRRLLSSLADAHAHGVAVDFAPLFEGTGAGLAELPTYAFQRQRYWLEAGTGAGDASSLGQASTEHPLLGAAIAMAEEGSHLFTARLSLREQPWLADHAVAGTPILPATAFAELALHAGREVGAGYLEELLLEAPLHLPEQRAVQLRLTLEAAAGGGEDGAYELAIYSRPEPAAGEEPVPFVRHAGGTLAGDPSAGADGLAPFAPEQWPPPGAEPLAVEGLYERLADAGLEYGPAFQGLEAAWGLGEETYAEVSLDPEQAEQAAGYGVHPALLDSALHAALLGSGDEAPTLRMPFSLAGVRLHGAGAAKLRVRLRGEGEAISVGVADADGAPLCTISTLAVRELDRSRLLVPAAAPEALFSLHWQPLEVEGAGDGEKRASGEGEPELVACVPAPDREPAAAARALCDEVLERLQAAIGAAGPALAFLTEGAVATDPSESPDPAAAAVWGLVRSAQSEHPGRFLLIDSDGSPASREALAAAVAQAREPQLALRQGVTLVPRLRPAGSGELRLPAGPWQLHPGQAGSLEELELVAAPEMERPLRGGEVRIGVRAAGLNFRDVLISLGMGNARMGELPIGGEGAGVVLEVGSEVGDLAPGDSVLGLFPGAFGPLAIAERRQLAPLPRGWSFAQGAAVPAVYATAHHGLLAVGDLRAGERVLVHAGAGGVGMAAIQIAQHLGAEVFATASPGKWGALRALGLDDAHIASSRDLEFEQKFLQVSGGAGMDLVLNSLAREYVDASLRLLPRGGRFLEMGKTDVRDAEEVAAAHPGVAYRGFDIVDFSPELTQETLLASLDLFARGAVRQAPLHAFDARHARQALRHLSQGRHVGKVVLTFPPAPSIPRRRSSSPAAPAPSAPTSPAISSPATVPAGCCSSPAAVPPPPAPPSSGLSWRSSAPRPRSSPATSASRARLAELLAGIDPAHPLGAVVHCAGALDDALLDAQGPRRLELAFAPKADAAWALHELTAAAGLSDFVLYSSLAGVAGSPGQANYAAANAFLDALAQQRAARGEPATAIAWGLWEEASGLTAGLAEEDRARVARSGLGLVGGAEGMELFDRARLGADALSLAAPVDRTALRSLQRAGALPPLLADLAGGTGRRRPAGGALAGRLAAVAASERLPLLVELVREHAAAVLGHGGRGRSTRPPASRTSASTRWGRWSCATGSAPPAASASPRRSSSTTRAPRPSPPTC